MPRPPSKTSRVSLYQLESELDLSTAIRAPYRDRQDFAASEVTIAQRTGLIIRGSIVRESASWSGLVGDWADDNALVAGIGNATAACVILLPLSDPESDRVWAICFGMGFQLLEPSRVVPDFGRRLAVRCADPAKIRSLTHTKLDSRAYVARTSIPGGDDLLGFGTGELGDLVSRVVGPAMLDGLVAGDGHQPVELRGADAANLPLAKDPVRLLADLDALELLTERDPSPQLIGIEQLRAIKKADARIAQLEAVLDTALGDAAEHALGLAWPTELADEAVPLSHFEVEGLPRGHSTTEETGDPALETVLSSLAPLPAGERTKRLDRMRIQAFSDEDQPASNLLPARRWLAFEATLDDRRYCMHDGRWYQIDDGLATALARRIESIVAVGSPLGDLPDWGSGLASEAEYNAMLATHLGGVSLDAKLLICDTHSAPGFEACDVLTPAGILIHVKRIENSAPASHLWAQAGVSTETLLRDPSAMSRLRALVAEHGGDPDWVPERIRQVVVAMASPRIVDVTDLFSFSQMRLARFAEECRVHNIELSVATIRRVSTED